MNRPSPEGDGIRERLKPAISAKAESVPAKAGLSRRGLPVRGSLPFNGEAGIVVMALVGNVRFDNLVRHLPAATAEIAARPDMTSPIAFSNLGKFSQQNVRTFPFKLLNKATDRHLWGMDSMT